VTNQPSRRTVEQSGRPIRARPAQRIEPASQPPLHARIGELAITAALPDFRGMVAPSFARRVLDEAPGIGDAELLRQHSDGTGWCFGWVFKKGAEKSGGAELHGKAKAHVGATTLADQVSVGIIQVEKARELFRRRFSSVTGITAFLLFGKKTDGHSVITCQRHGLTNRHGPVYR
jgi:hypothetical protein